mmetsp:Transcript_10911/g.36101  ORF Transcript_10911/g.36101 Transcript_10911/m.36101 type:complete len:325 (-) Transcript_10911:7-981(-)
MRRVGRLRPVRVHVVDHLADPSHLLEEGAVARLELRESAQVVARDEHGQRLDGPADPGRVHLGPDRRPLQSPGGVVDHRGHRPEDGAEVGHLLIGALRLSLRLELLELRPRLLELSGQLRFLRRGHLQPLQPLLLRLCLLDVLLRLRLFARNLFELLRNARRGARRRLLKHRPQLGLGLVLLLVRAQLDLQLLPLQLRLGGHRHLHRLLLPQLLLEPRRPLLHLRESVRGSLGLLTPNALLLRGLVLLSRHELCLQLLLQLHHPRQLLLERALLLLEQRHVLHLFDHLLARVLLEALRPSLGVEARQLGVEIGAAGTSLGVGRA